MVELKEKKEKKTVGERFYYLSEWLFELIKHSFYFWMMCFRGFCLFSIIASFDSLAAVSLDVWYKERKKTSENFKSNYHNTDRKRFLSVLVVFLLVYSLIAFILPLEVIGESIQVGIRTLAFLIILCLLILLSTNKVFLLLMKHSKWNSAIHIYLLGKAFGWTLLLGVIITLIVWFSFRNLIFLIAFAPGLIGISGAIIGDRIAKKLGGI
jgi:uncharacterized membrane protein YesL